MNKNEIKIEKDNKFITRYGSTMEEEKPSVVYLRTKSKITPLKRQKEYDINVNRVKGKFTAFVENCVYKSKSVGNDFLFNIDISSKSLRYGKVSFLRYDLYLKPTKRRAIKDNLYRMRQLSIKLDRKLEKLLNSNNMACKLQ